MRRWFIWQRNFVVITDQRAILRRAAGGKSKSIPIDTVADVEAQQTTLDRLLDEGALRIGLTSGKAVLLNHVLHPVVLGDQILLLATALRNEK